MTFIRKTTKNVNDYTDTFSAIRGYTTFSNVIVNHALQSKTTWPKPISRRHWGNPQMISVNVTGPWIIILTSDSSNVTAAFGDAEERRE